LGILGSKSLETPYVKISLTCTIFYFLFFYLSSFIFSEKGSKFLIFILNLINFAYLLSNKFGDKFNYFINSIKKFNKEKSITLYVKICGYFSILKSAIAYPNGVDFIKKYEREK